MENIWPIIIVGAVAAIAGYLFGMLDSRVTTVLKEGREKVVAAEEEKASTLKLDEHDVLKATIDSGLKWHLELDGVRIEPDELTSEQRARLVNVIVQIRPWIDGKTLAAPVAPPPPPAPTQLAAPISAPVSIGIQPAATPAPRLDIGRGFRSILESDLGKKSDSSKSPSIVGMIDEVLQKKLAVSPLAAKKIRLEEGSVGEVIVYVGAIRYSGIDSIPDEDIKTIIREAIEEWNTK
jgi:hypothetical protein